MSALNIRIIPADPTYAEGFRHCLDTVARERRFLAFLEAPPAEAARGFVKMMAAGGGIQLFAIDEIDRVVGWCDIVPNDREGFRHAGQLGMGLLPEARGHGIGTMLVRSAVERAWAAGLERIELDVFASNSTAIHLYAKLGFVREGVKRRGRKLDDYEDVVVMALLRDVTSPAHPA